MNVAAGARSLWAKHRTAHSRLSRRVALAATIVFLLVVCRWRPWDLFARGGFSTDFYDAQAHAFWRLRLDVPADIASQEGFLIGGRTYLYYGPLLALVRMPFALFGHWADGRLSRVSMVGAFWLACMLAYHLVRHVAQLLRTSQMATPLRCATLVAAIACSPALSLAGWNSVYDETEMWAFTFFLATAVALLRLWQTPSRRALIIAATAALCTVLTRSSVGFGALAAVGMVGLLLWRRDRRLATLAVGVPVGGLLLAIAINVAKFGTLLDLPANQQVLTLRSPIRAAWFAGNGGSFFSPRFLPTTVVQYFRPDAFRIERLVPLIRYGPLATERGSYPLETNTPSSSLTASATLLFVLAFLGVWVIIRRRSWPLVALWVGAIIAAVPSFLIGFVANRYLVDMLPALVVPAAVVLATISAPAWFKGRVIRAIVILLALWGLWINVALATWTQNLQEPGFTDLRYRLDEAVFGGDPPSVITLVPGASVPRDGIVAIDLVSETDRTCDGLYIAQQGAWVALELAEGSRRLAGVSQGDGSPIRVTTNDGELSITFADARATTLYTPDGGGEPIVGESVAVGAGAVAVDITSDPVTSTFHVSVAGRLAMFGFIAPSLNDAEVSGLAPRAGGQFTQVCDSLQDRR